MAYIVLHEMPYSLPCSLHREDHTGITRRAEPVVDEAGELEAMLEFKSLELANCMPSEVCICDLEFGSDCMLCEFGTWNHDLAIDCTGGEFGSVCTTLHACGLHG